MHVSSVLLLRPSRPKSGQKWISLANLSVLLEECTICSVDVTGDFSNERSYHYELARKNQKSCKSSVGSATRTAFSTAIRAITSCPTAPQIGGKRPKEAATIPMALAAIPPSALCNAMPKQLRL